MLKTRSKSKTLFLREIINTTEIKPWTAKLRICLRTTQDVSMQITFYKNRFEKPRYIPLPPDSPVSGIDLILERSGSYLTFCGIEIWRDWSASVSRDQLFWILQLLWLITSKRIGIHRRHPKNSVWNIQVEIRYSVSVRGTCGLVHWIIKKGNKRRLSVKHVGDRFIDAQTPVVALKHTPWPIICRVWTSI